MPKFPKVDITRSIRGRAKPLTVTHQKQLVQLCQSDDIGIGIRVTALLYLQGGMMYSEIARLDIDQQLINLNAGVPHLIIDGDTKTKDRKRIVPIVLQPELVKAGLEAAILHCRKSHSHRYKYMAKLLNEATGESYYHGHALRHTLRLNAQNNGVQDSELAAIGGWASSGRVSTSMLGYGAEGLSSSESVLSLQRASLNIHRHLL